MVKIKEVQTYEMRSKSKTKLCIQYHKKVYKIHLTEIWSDIIKNFFCGIKNCGCQRVIYNFLIWFSPPQTKSFHWPKKSYERCSSNDILHIFVWDSYCTYLRGHGFSLSTFVLSYFFFFLMFWAYHVACEILFPWPGIELSPPALEARSLKHWTDREIPQLF